MLGLAEGDGIMSPAEIAADDTQAEAERKRRDFENRPRLTPIQWSEIHKLPKRKPLVTGVLDVSSLSVLYGASNCGKSFFALDIAAHLAMGREWRGRETHKGAVIYIAAEGGLGIEERLTAWRIHHDIDVEGVPLYVIPEPIDLGRIETDAALLIQRLAPLPKPALIIIDTLSRAMAGGNENSPDDMGRFVGNCDKLRLATKAHVMVIHHSGKDDTRGARGHSLLRAAADTEIEVTADETGTRTASIVKQRDYRTGDPFGFRLEPVDIGQDEAGNPVTSCVVVATDAPARSAASKKPVNMPKAARTALRALAEALDTHGTIPPANGHVPHNVRVVSVDDWRQTAYKLGISASDEQDAKRKAFGRASEHLIADQRIGFWEGNVWLPS
jgi:hypothetical protein